MQQMKVRHFDYNPWPHLRSLGKMHFVGKPKFVSRIGGIVLVSVSPCDTDDVYSFTTKAEFVGHRDLSYELPVEVSDKGTLKQVSWNGD